MFKLVKRLTSVVAMFAVLFTFTTETMAAKKSKTLKNTQKKGFVRCGVSQGLPGFSNADAFKGCGYRSYFRRSKLL